MYLWIKSLHIIFMVAWFAGLFYIFRLFVYHVKHRENQSMTEAYSVMEKKLLYAISHPAMLLTLGFGIWMIVLNPLLLKQAWLHAKLGAVALLIAYQIFSGITFRRFKKGDYFLSEKACRWINEVPTLLLVTIVFLVVLKPHF